MLTLQGRSCAIVSDRSATRYHGKSRFLDKMKICIQSPTLLPSISTHLFTVASATNCPPSRRSPPRRRIIGEVPLSGSRAHTFSVVLYAQRTRGIPVALLFDTYAAVTGLPKGGDSRSSGEATFAGSGQLRGRNWRQCWPLPHEKAAKRRTVGAVYSLGERT